MQPRAIIAQRRERSVVARGSGQGVPGPTGPAGDALTTVEWDESGTVDHATQNIVLADDVVLTIPTGLANGEPFKFIVPQAYAGFALNGGDATLNGQTGDVGFTTPCAITLVYLEAESNLFIESESYGQTPA